MPQRDLPRMYKAQLFANEVMLLPYYIAALNIEHAYYELTGTYEPFEGLCFVDTLDLAESRQAGFSFMTEKNTQRVERQKKAPITVIIGNPPYNVGQLNENDNNKNRKYDVIDGRISQTYARDSSASNRNALSDAYVKFFRWAIDRLGPRDGIVCFISNNNFIDQHAFDGMRKHLSQDFTTIYHVDLNGNVRRNPKLSGTTHNVFGIQTGVGITVAAVLRQRRKHRLFYHRVPETWRKEEKLAWLGDRCAISGVEWREVSPDAEYNWIVPEATPEYSRFVRLASQAVKSGVLGDDSAVFASFSIGVKTNRDDVAYDFDPSALGRRIAQFVEDYNAEIDRYRRAPKGASVDEFVRLDRVKWSETLKRNLIRGRCAQYSEHTLRCSLYRPFSKKYVCFNPLISERLYGFPAILPNQRCEEENRVVCCTNHSQLPFVIQITSCIPNEAVGGRQGQCFPFYIYDEDGTNRRENITDWALKLFRDHYQDPSIEKWDLFYYVYGVLHHPAYRQKFADNLKRELPRIPLAPPAEEGAKGPRGQGAKAKASGFWAFADAGKELAHWHLDYEQIEPYDLQFVEKKTIGATTPDQSPKRERGANVPDQSPTRQRGARSAPRSCAPSTTSTASKTKCVCRRTKPA